MIRNPDYSLLPEKGVKTIRDYVEKGYKPGGFILALLANDLSRSFGTADTDNYPHIGLYVHYIHWEVPEVCHGSYQIVDAWLKRFKNQEEQ